MRHVELIDPPIFQIEKIWFILIFEYLFNYIEKSKINYTDTIYHIPYFHLYCQEETHKKNIGDGIFLVKLNYFDQVDY